MKRAASRLQQTVTHLESSTVRSPFQHQQAKMSSQYKPSVSWGHNVTKSSEKADKVSNLTYDLSQEASSDRTTACRTRKRCSRVREEPEIALWLLCGHCASRGTALFSEYQIGGDLQVRSIHRPQSKREGADFVRSGNKDEYEGIHKKSDAYKKLDR